MSSTKNPSYGTKVKDSNAPNIEEGAGAVVSDSLAAESTRAGGVFGENRDGEPQGESGSKPSFANKDTSGAVSLDPAPDSEARQTQEDWAEESRSGEGATSYPAKAGGQSKGLAVENTTIGGDGEGVARTDVDTAPSYVNSQYIDSGKPKGKNLKEGGFEGYDGKNASFNNEIGTKNDPGRLAEEKFQRQNADASERTGMPSKQGFGETNEYNALDPDISA